MNKGFKIFRIILVIVLLALVSGIIYVNKTHITGNIEDANYVNSLYNTEGYVYTNYLNDVERNLYAKILKAVKKHEDSIQFVPEEEGLKFAGDNYTGTIDKVFVATLLDHPELLSYSGYRLYYSNDTNIITYELKYAEHFEFMDYVAEAIINLKLDKIVKDTENMTDREKIIYVYEYIGDMTYDRVFQNFQKNQTVYNTFLKGNAVCAGFAKTATLIFKHIGIEAYSVHGYTTDLHMWNIVKYEDKYYYFDSTVAAGLDKSSKFFYEGLKASNFSKYTLYNAEWFPMTIEEDEDMFAL